MINRPELQLGYLPICIQLVPPILNDGLYVAFASIADNLVPGVTSNLQIYVRNLQTTQNNRVSVDNNGTEAYTDAVNPKISSVGRYVAFTSNATNLGAPLVITDNATMVILHSATLKGTVNPNGLSTNYYFQYGTTSSYGNQTSTQSAGVGTSAVAVSANVSRLTPNTVYHFRLVATNSAGTTYGSDMTLKASVNFPPWLMLLLGD